MHLLKKFVCQFFPIAIGIVFFGGLSVGVDAQTTVSNPSACGLGLPIEDDNCPETEVFFNPNRYTIDVNNAPGTALGVDVFLKEVQLIIQHEWAGDLDIYLISPAGKVIDISSDNGGGEDDYGRFSTSGCVEYTSFAVGACKSIEEGEAPFLDGPYAPEQSFYLFNDGVTNPNGDWILQLCDDVGEDAGTLEYVHLIFEPLSCLPIIDVAVTDIDSTTVIIDWDADESDCGTSIIEYGLPGFTPGTTNSPGQGQIVTGGCPPLAITGLAENTTYDIYVRKSCAPGSFSVNSCVIQATSGCQPPPRTLSETFASATTCDPLCGISCPLDGLWQNAVIDDFDWIAHSGPTPTLGTGPDSDVNGDGQYVYLETSGGDCTAGKEAHLVSNCIRINKFGSDTCNLAFNYHMFGDNVGSLSLEVSDDGGETWTPLWSESGSKGNQWLKVYLGLAEYNDGDIVQFRFVGKGGNGSKGDIALDNIVFFGSENASTALNQYFVDVDGDGYGNADQFFFSCIDTPPDGFVTDGTDCNDANPMVNPGMPEIPCDNIDNNCNDDVTDDDPFLPLPQVTNDTICSGEQPLICATPGFGRPIFWYGSPDGQDFINFGECFTPVLPLNNTSLPIEYKFYAQETDFACGSVERAEVVVVVNPNPDLSVGAGPEICPGETINLSNIDIQETNFTGASITFHSGNPTTPENQLNTNVITLDGTTNYYVQAAATGGCTDVALLPVTVKAGPTLSFSPSDSILLCKDGAGTVTVVPTGGTGNYEYLWSNGREDPSIDINSSFFSGAIDRYSVRVTDVTGCFSEDTVKVVTATSIDSIRRQINNVTTCGGTDGAIAITPLNGVAPFNYSWSSGNGVGGNASGVDGTFNLENLSQASYRITITDSSVDPCEFILRSVLVNGPDAEVSAPTIDHVSCAGAGDGQICLNVNADNPVYLWSNGATTECIEDLAGGTYSVTITEGVCETVLTDILVEEPEELKSIAEPLPPTCFSFSDGSIDLSVFGGTGPYTFNWSNGASVEDPAGLAAGSYNVVVQDANGCTTFDTLEVIGPERLSANLERLDNMSCTDVADGVIQVSGNGGILPYKYFWSNGSTTPLIAGLDVGSYPVQVTDLNGCTATAIFDISEPDPIDASLLAFSEPDCVGDTTGSVTIQVNGGSPSFSFTWEHGPQDSILTGLGVGNYSVVVTDSNNCPADTVDIELSAVSELELAATINQPECVGLKDGSISLTPSGLGPFTYDWSTGATTNVLSDIGVGTYGVVIGDAQGCILDTTITVEAPQVFKVDIGVRQPSCFESRDGVINVSLLESGPAPLGFSWSNGSTNQSLVGVGAGRYVLTIQAGNQCEFVSDTLSIENPAPLELNIDGVGEISCFGDSTGFIELTIGGGQPPYDINWAGLDTDSEDLFDLAAGNYRLQMEDANECPIDTTFVLGQPAQLEAEADIQTGGTCEQSDADRLVGSASGGIGPYLFAWSNGVEEPILDRPETGDYELYIEDANGCTDTLASIKLKSRVQPLQLDTFFVTEVSCAGFNDAEMTAIVSGGSSSLRYHFSNNFILNTGADSVTTTDLVLNQSYRVTITDLATGCVVVSDFEQAKEPPVLNLMRDSIRQIQCFGEEDGAIFTSTIGGTPPYHFEWFNAENQVIDSVANLVDIPVGAYRVRVTDFNGCQDSLQQTTLDSANDRIDLIDSLTTIDDVKCKGGNSGSIAVALSGGTTPYTYEWNNGGADRILENLPAGTYELSVTDAKGCGTTIPPLTIEEPAASIEVNITKIDISCAGEASGRLDAVINGGSPPYALGWRFEETILGTEDRNRLDSLLAGRYYLTVRDTNECILVDSIDILEPLPLEIMIEQEGNLFRAIVAGGTSPYSYSWSNGANSETIAPLEDGEYSVVVTDGNFCRISASTLLVDVLNKERVVDFQLFPNPVIDVLQGSLQTTTREDLTFGIRNLLGVEVIGNVSTDFQQGHFSMDLSNLAAGVYIFQVSGEAGVYISEKIIKL